MADIMNGKNGILQKNPRESINPYITAAALIKQRLLWDIKPLAWKSREKIKALKNYHYGEKAIILCNGPSLNEVNFSLLKDSKVFTFGLNKINLLFERTEFRPSCIVAVNRYVIEQNKDFYNKTQIPLFLDSKGKKWIEFKQNVYFLQKINLSGFFARDCSLSICQGSTVTFVAMQLAFHMGFVSVALVGCDHSFAVQGRPNETLKSGATDPNHFDPRYFASGLKWQSPDLTSSEFHYEQARDTFNNFNRKIINCTEGGKLELFEREKLETFLQS